MDMFILIIGVSGTNEEIFVFIGAEDTGGKMAKSLIAGIFFVFLFQEREGFSYITRKVLSIGAATLIIIDGNPEFLHEFL